MKEKVYTSSSNKQIYLLCEQSMEVENKSVKLQDIAQVCCLDKEVTRQLYEIEIYSFQMERTKVISTLYIVERIMELYPDYMVENIGPTDILIYYAKDSPKSKWRERCYIAFVSAIAFLGSAFSIMTYDNDTGMRELLLDLHELFMGEEAKNEHSIIMVTYAIGVTIGVILFFIHGKRRHGRQEPTPLQVQMRLYEQDVNQSIVIDADRKSEEKNVDS